MSKEKRVEFNILFKSVFSLELTPKTKSEILYTKEEYLEFINILGKLKPKNYKILENTLKDDEILYSHSMEADKDATKRLVESMVDPTIRKDSIKYITNKRLKQGMITIFNIKQLHSILMTGISVDKDGNKNFRKNDDVFVGYYENNEKVVQYLPPKSENIVLFMKEILALINDPEPMRMEEYLFVHPIVIHALIAIVQPFDDGNTRTSRVINYSMILDYTNKLYQKSFNLPIIYLSRSYSAFREQYRSLIANLAIEPSNENWNKWIDFNMFMIQTYFNYVKEIIYNNNLIKSEDKNLALTIDKC